MSCPDENTFARLQAGVLSSEEVAVFHRHVDNCETCLELTKLLGCMPAVEVSFPTVSGESTWQESMSVDRQPAKVADRRTVSRRFDRVLITEVGMLIAHANLARFSLRYLSSTWTHGNAVYQSAVGLAIHCVAVWGILGLILSVVSVIGLWARFRWGRSAAVVHAVISIPTVVLAPLGVFVLVVLNWGRDEALVTHQD